MNACQLHDSLSQRNLLNVGLLSILMNRDFVLIVTESFCRQKGNVLLLRRQMRRLLVLNVKNIESQIALSFQQVKADADWPERLCVDHQFSMC